MTVSEGGAREGQQQEQKRAVNTDVSSLRRKSAGPSAVLWVVRTVLWVELSAGRLPKFATEQMLAPKGPPMIAPKLAVQASVVVQPDLKMADNTMPPVGSPTSALKGFSMGSGSGTGIGSGDGSGVGRGSGGNTGGGVYHVGGGVSEPVVIHEVDPVYSEAARKAKFDGVVEVYLIVDEHGMPTHVGVSKGVGMGLDEKAMEAVRQYRFKPAMKDGKAVKVDMYIEVNYRIF